MVPVLESAPSRSGRISRPGRFPSVFLALWMLWLGGGMRGASSDKPLPPEKEYLESVFAKIRAWEKNPPLPTFRERRVTTDFDGDKVDSRLEEIYAITWYRDKPVYVLERKNGKAMTAESLRLQESRKKKAIDEEIAKPSSKEKIDAIYVSPLLDRYRYKLVGRETLWNRPAIKIRFDPIPGKFPEKKIASKIMENVYGYGWIDEEDNELTKAVVHNNGTIRIGWGILASLSHLEIEYHRQKRPSGLWYVSFLKVRAKVRIFFFNNYNRLSESTFYDVMMP